MVVGNGSISLVNPQQIMARNSMGSGGQGLGLGIPFGQVGKNDQETFADLVRIAGRETSEERRQFLFHQGKVPRGVG